MKTELSPLLLSVQLLMIGGSLALITCSDKDKQTGDEDTVVAGEGAKQIGVKAEHGDLAFTVFRQYPQLKRLTKEPRNLSAINSFDCRLSSPYAFGSIHFDTRIHLYVNTLADDIISQNRRTFPEGSVIVKEKLSQEGMVTGVGGMIKRSSSYDDKSGNWEYFYSEPGKGFANGRLKKCADCHIDVRDRDYVFNVWALETD